MRVDVKITLTHYQHPAAIRDLKEWEILFWDKIIYKSRIDDDILFILEPSSHHEQFEQYEVVYCTPIPSGVVSQDEEILRIQEDIQLHIDDYFDRVFEDVMPVIVMKWNKHIIYGSAASEQLFFLANFQTAYVKEMEGFTTCRPNQEERDRSGHGDKLHHTGDKQ